MTALSLTPAIMSASHSSPASIIVFDSGIGGLSVADKIRALMPGLSIDYVADNRIYPYGLQEERVLIDRVCTLIPALETRYHPRAIVMACNTASTVVLDALRQQTSTPVIGVVPAIKPAAERTHNGVIGLLATPGTIHRQYTNNLIGQFAGHCQVLRIGASELVALAENKLRGIPVDQALLNRLLAPFILHTPCPDVIVLGCTHFPFLADEIHAALPPGTLLLDSGEAIARRTRHLLGDDAVAEEAEHRFLFTEETPYAHALTPALQDMGYPPPEFLHL